MGKEKKIDKESIQREASEILSSLYSPAPTPRDAVEFIDRIQIVDVLRTQMEERVKRVHLPDLMRGLDYHCKRIGGRPYWLAVPVV